MTGAGPSDRDVAAASRYFWSFADDYHRAFEGSGENLLHRTLNRLFRRRTFELRTKVVEETLAAYGLRGRSVLDVGCGSGEVSLVAARLGAESVTGLDIVPEMGRSLPVRPRHLRGAIESRLRCATSCTTRFPPRM